MQPGRGTYVKGRDNTLPGWLCAAANRCEDAMPGSVAEMIRSCNHGKNDICNFRLRSKEELRFKASKRGTWMQQLPRFNENVPNNEDDNLSQNLLAHPPLGFIMKTLLPVVIASDIGYDLYQWVLEYQQLSNLIGAKLWNRC